MKNIGGRYNKKENIEGNKFIKEYSIQHSSDDEDDDEMLIAFANHDSWKIPANNYEKVIDSMESQAKHQVTKVLPILKKEEATDIIGTVITFAACALCASGETFGLNLKEETMNIIQIALGALSATGLTLSFVDISKIINIKRYELFLQKKDGINSTVRESHNLIRGASNTAKKTIVNDLSDFPINYGNIDNFSREDLIKLSQNVETQKTFDFQFDDPIVKKELK